MVYISEEMPEDDDSS